MNEAAGSSFDHDPAEPVVWSGYPSWRHFSWLYLMSAAVAARGVLFRRFDVPGWEAWLLGAGLLLVTAAILRRWAHYEMTPGRLLIRNGYTGRVIAQCPFSQVADVDVRQGPIATLLGIGTLVIRGRGDKVVRFRGLAHPDLIKQRIESAKRSSGAAPAAAGF